MCSFEHLQGALINDFGHSVKDDSQFETVPLPGLSSCEPARKIQPGIEFRWAAILYFVAYAF